LLDNGISVHVQRPSVLANDAGELILAALLYIQCQCLAVHADRMIILTNLVPKGFSACALWPFIFVRPDQRANFALIEHERVHYREQAWIMPAWVLLYLTSRQFRLAAEVRAYTRQIEMGGISQEQAAQALLGYRLGITLSDAMKAMS
jgi:hypothetical protein